MHQIKVWAPAIGQVDIEINGKRAPMRSTSDGNWTFASDELEHGCDYALWLDDEGPLPDPRSPWQPQGVHGASRWLDHNRFEWNNSAWEPVPVAQAIIYELHIGTFTEEGTFMSAIAKLNELKEVGITHIEIMPVAEFSGSRGWGYDGVDLYAPHHCYGGPDGLKTFVDACHQRGLGVILDVVYNHLGAEGNYLEKFANYFKPDVKTPWGNAVNLDGPGSEHVRRFFIDNALMWLRDYHFDGLRLDATHALVDKSPRHFLAQLTTEVKELGVELGRHVFLIAENDSNEPAVVRTVEEGGWGFDAQGNEDFHHALHALLTAEYKGYFIDYGSVGDLATVLSENFCLVNRFSEFRQKVFGSSAKEVESSHYIAFSQNHDQTGNRPYGERLSHLVNHEKLKIAAAITLLSPFVPMLFQGEEWAASSRFYYFADLCSEELRAAVCTGRRQEFCYMLDDVETIPDPCDEKTWLQSQLRWGERQAGKHKDMLDWYRMLISLRTSEPDFAAGKSIGRKIEYSESPAWLSIHRGSFRIICNFSPDFEQISCCESEQLELVGASRPTETFVDSGKISMPAHCVAIYRKRDCNQQ